MKTLKEITIVLLGMVGVFAAMGEPTEDYNFLTHLAWIFVPWIVALLVYLIPVRDAQDN